VIARGQSKVTGVRFNIAVAFEASDDGGRAIAESTFHISRTTNWDPGKGRPGCVTESQGNGLAEFPKALRATKRMASRCALGSMRTLSHRWVWFTVEAQLAMIERLRRKLSPDLAQDRTSLCICPECATLGCGVISLVVEGGAGVCRVEGFGCSRSDPCSYAAFSESSETGSC